VRLARLSASRAQLRGVKVRLPHAGCSDKQAAALYRTQSTMTQQRSEGAVEVLKDPLTRTWYVGHVVDVVGKDELRIGFKHDNWSEENFPYASVRKFTARQQIDAEKFNPQIGDEVELFVDATEHHPQGWAGATVRNIKHSFYFVSRVLADDKAPGGEAIVEKNMLRPVAPSRGLNPGSLKQETFKIAAALKDWVASEDALGCFGLIEEQSGLLFIKAHRGDLLLVGDQKAVNLAKNLLDVHTKHQTQIQNFQDMRERRLRALEQKRNRIEGTGFAHSAEFSIDPQFIPRVIGKAGEAIKAVEEKFEVNIRIMDVDDANGLRTIRIFGNNVESIEQARGEVEYVEEALPIEPEKAKYVKGSGGKTLRQFTDLNGLIYARLDRETSSLLVCGSRFAVEDAMAMFETHLMYYHVFREMNVKMDELVRKLKDYGDYNVSSDWGTYYDEDDEQDWWGYSKGKSKGKGKDKGKEKGKDKGKEKGKTKGGWDWEEEDGNSRQVAVRPAKGSGKGGKEPRGKGKSDWQSEEQEGERKGEKGKGGKKGKGKSDWQHEEEEEQEDRKGEKGKGGKKGKGKSDWQQEEDAEQDGKGKGGKKGKGKGKSEGKNDWVQEEEPEEESAGKKGKGKGKARGSWRKKSEGEAEAEAEAEAPAEEEAADDQEDEAWEGESAPSSKGRGRGPRTRVTRQAIGDKDSGSGQAAPNRKMGKKGIRS